MTLSSFLGTLKRRRAALRPRHDFFCLGAVLCITAQLQLPAAAADKIEYNRDIRPILSENCFPCHGPDSAARKAGLRLDHFNDAIAPRKDKQPAIVPGKPNASELVHRINARDRDDIMPPAKTQKTLTARQKDLLARWVAGGAVYQPLWSFIPPVQPELPKVHNRRWVRNPIDDFILARLEKEGLKPAPEADRRTLIRRVTLDLTGLPPKPEEVEAFVNDTSANAYEKVVDRLLATPQYGEHRARYWLDDARYADTHGIHMDNYREMWAYRDWVIKAFNANESFDQFTIDQLAGDLLPKHTLDQEIATGFNRCNITSSEGGAIDEEYLVLYARDRTYTTAQVWLGLTAGCAVCHDHKFDPLSQKEFYSMSAFFNNTTQAAMDGNVKDTPPNLPVPLEPDRPRWTVLDSDKKAAQEKLDHRRETGHADFDVWATNSSHESFTKSAPKDEPMFHALLADNKPATNQPQTLNYTLKGEAHSLTLADNAGWRDGVVASKAFLSSSKYAPVLPEVGDFERDHAYSYGIWVYIASKKSGGALFARMNDGPDYRGWDMGLEGDYRVNSHLVSKWPDDAAKVISKTAVETNRWTHICVTYDGSSKAAGMNIYIDGKLQEKEIADDKLASSIRATVPFKIGQRNNSSQLDGVRLQDLRIYDRVLTADEIKALSRGARLEYLLTRAEKHDGEKEQKELYNGWLEDIDAEYQKDVAAVAAVDKDEREIRARGTEALVMHEKPEPAIAYVLYRGDYDKRRDKVEANTPAALPPMPADYPRNRLGFARWLMRPENPLTARVTVNRFWQQIFGAGIVRTTGDFGVTGEIPSNQELLDWLAVDFRESGWDVKGFFKLLVTSAAYRQAAIMTPAKLAKDPDNQLLSRGPRFRMDAEMIRDYALSASGLLVPKIGGPSVKPYQPDGVWEAVAMDSSNTKVYNRDTGESLYRRSLYTFWKRSAPPASLEIFNAPSRETCTVRRERGDTPLQALVTLNDTQFVEAARNLAQLTLEKGGADEPARLNFMAERLLARPLRPEETKITDAALKELLNHYQADPKDAATLLKVGDSKADPALPPPTLAAYTMVANELMNLDEVLNK